ncbi:Xaa-Pro peptidase family protein [Albimonas sp. CAU 1670]|uniref:M24 family metallopeptidase n=1 Tax=Albimonas sp. CAU 1670 TaxID=3032599 RepID=UPI0023D9A69C|nr:Xaa-Pro peptidase family protein [Albimonas sp. CAU 1670]MDF2235629.1 Xaa-Pro peptidase family protein [Albimonas sp. CAU 1670]
MTAPDPPRGFPEAEHRARLALLQAAMAARGLAALLLTTEAEIRWVTGFLTRFWESPTRPWFLVVPAQGDPVAVIPSIGAELMGRTWIRDIRCWSSPDYADDGVSLLAATLAERSPPDAEIGLPMGRETRLRMPLADWLALSERIGRRRFRDDGGLMRDLRLVKSEAEIEKIAAACAVAGRAFARTPEILRPGLPLSELFRRFQILCLEEGADQVPYLAGGAAPGGYGDVISPASDRPLARGDVVMLDTGLSRDGYFADFDRNWSLGPPAPEVADAHARLVEATDVAAGLARPGATPADLAQAMRAVLGGGEIDVGRLGHGLGMELTEPPSLIAADLTPLRPGMVLTLEPSIPLGPGRLLVHEEVIVVREDGPQFLSPRIGPGIPVV